MVIIGYCHLRSVDAFRYPILLDQNGIPYFNYNNKKNIINFNFEGTDNYVVLDKSFNYNDYQKNAADGFPYIYINNVKIVNNNIIKL